MGKGHKKPLWGEGVVLSWIVDGGRTALNILKSTVHLACWTLMVCNYISIKIFLKESKIYHLK